MAIESEYPDFERFGRNKSTRGANCTECSRGYKAGKWVAWDNWESPAVIVCMDCAWEEVNAGRGTWRNVRSKGEDPAGARSSRDSFAGDSRTSIQDHAQNLARSSEDTQLLRLLLEEMRAVRKLLEGGQLNFEPTSRAATASVSPEPERFLKGSDFASKHKHLTVHQFEKLLNTNGLDLLEHGDDFTDIAECFNTKDKFDQYFDQNDLRWQRELKTVKQQIDKLSELPGMSNARLGFMIRDFLPPQQLPPNVTPLKRS